MPTVKDVTFNLLRRLDLTTIVGNPGSTEETFLKNFPADFEYVLALQEASVVGIADGLSQGLRKPVVVNVHTGAGLGNAMGCILTAYQNKTPPVPEGPRCSRAPFTTPQVPASRFRQCAGKASGHHSAAGR